ncbi:alpha/beta hydrolase family protein [Paenibacillus rigui]|uniref:Chlorophyllase n=1 Tax=Paenibacillus rigui TaxID=554312 RepID=A0A229UN34_9BACL|nr:alpha/beta fold hydrolase [Paenibacillus rigui]OXM84791.1 chlorophyllase [Paenibacillus rigui]
MEMNVSTPAPVVSIKSIVLPAAGRDDNLQVRVSMPAIGSELPIIVFSHGFGSSLDGYGPLVDYWAAHGFVVIQPTHLDSRTLSLPPDDPRTPLIWRFRVEDMKRILDQLNLIEASVPGLSGRLDQSRIAAAGHSWGGQTVSMLLGARVLDAHGKPGEDMSDPRIKAGVLLATPGKGGPDLAPFAAEHFPFMNPSFSDMSTPTLVVAGDHDQSLLSTRGPDWFTDPYFLSPGSKSLLLLFGAEHSLGGIAGYDVAETTDENPERIALLQRLTWSYIRNALDLDDSSWPAARTALEESAIPLGRIESK